MTTERWERERKRKKWQQHSGKSWKLFYFYRCFLWQHKNRFPHRDFLLHNHRNSSATRHNIVYLRIIYIVELCARAYYRIRWWWRRRRCEQLRRSTHAFARTKVRECAPVDFSSICKSEIVAYTKIRTGKMHRMAIRCKDAKIKAFKSFGWAGATWFRHDFMLIEQLLFDLDFFFLNRPEEYNIRRPCRLIQFHTLTITASLEQKNCKQKWHF